jgi:hypothetical protein
MLGEVPIRDFMAYDLGRYYWSAAIMSLMSDGGIVANRVAAAIFQTTGLFFGLFLLAHIERPIRLAPLILAAGCVELTANNVALSAGAETYFSKRRGWNGRIQNFTLA